MRSNRRKSFIKVALLVSATLATILVLVVSAWGRELQISIRRADTSQYPYISIVTNLTGGKDAKLPLLTEKNFSLRENKEKVSSLEVEPILKKPEPLAVVLALDVSGSMKGKPLENAKSAARTFVELMKPQDQIAVVAFGSGSQIVSGLSNDESSLVAAIDKLEAQGETSLYDAIISGLDIVSETPTAHKSLIVLSDGKDTKSVNPLETVLKRSKETKIPIFGVGLESPEFDPVALKSISESSGGELLLAADPSALSALYAGLSKELHTQYRITYKSKSRKAKTLNLQLEMVVFGENASAETLVSNPNPTSEPRAETSKPERPSELPKFLPPSRVLIGTAFASFLAIFLLVLTAISLFYPSNKNLRNQMKFYDAAWNKSRYRKSTELNEATEQFKSSKLSGRILDNALRATDYVAGQRGFAELIKGKLEQAGLPLRPLEFILFHFVFTVAMAIIGSALARNPAAILVTAGIATAVGAMLPLLILTILINIRRTRFHEQLPDTLNLISGSMRSGYGLLQAMQVAAKEGGPPMSTELERTLAEARLGLPLEEALQKMAERVNENNFTWTVMAVNIQREVGGNLAEVLEIVADTIRERDKVKRQIKILTAEGRLSAIILSILPVVMAFVFFVLNPSYMLLLVTTGFGLAMVALALGLFTIGVLWLRKIVSIEV